MAVAEMRGLADTFSRLTEACYKKCIPNVKEGQLNVGEMSCTDRYFTRALRVLVRCLFSGACRNT